MSIHSKHPQANSLQFMLTMHLYTHSKQEDTLPCTLANICRWVGMHIPGRHANLSPPVDIMIIDLPPTHSHIPFLHILFAWFTVSRASLRETSIDGRRRFCVARLVAVVLALVDLIRAFVATSAFVQHEGKDE